VAREITQSPFAFSSLPALAASKLQLEHFSMPTVAITDYTFPNLDIERAILEPLGCEIVHGQCKTPEQLIPLVEQVDAVITQFAPVNADVIRAMQRSKAIVRYGIGVDNVDLQAAKEKGIPVCNVPDYCIDEVADHTLAFILATTRQVVPNTLLIRDGKWGLATELTSMRTLKDQTVGVVGFGRIGREVIARLRAFKPQILVYDPVVPPEAIVEMGAQPATLDMLLAQSDILTLHCPSTPETRKLLRNETIAKMKQGAIVINLARGDLIDTASITQALQTGRISSIAIDVCDPEPIPADSALRSHPNVIAASHIASASPKAVRKLRESAAQHAANAITNKRMVHVVNGVVS
jgi:D-3-phosphoglycerate dehydrogenase